MDIINILDVMADKITYAFNMISYLDALCIGAFFMCVVFILSLTHVLFGTKAKTMRRTRGIAKYFESNYMGSYLDAKRMLRKKRYLFTKKSREAFLAFVNSDSRILDTTFNEVVLKPGRFSLNIIGYIFSICIVISECFILLKGWISGLNSMNLMLFVVIPAVIMIVLKWIVSLAILHVNKSYYKNRERLIRAEKYVHYNNESKSVAFPSELNTKLDAPQTNVNMLTEQLEKGAKAVNASDKCNVLPSEARVLSHDDKVVYDEFLAKLNSGTI